MNGNASLVTTYENITETISRDWIQTIGLAKKAKT
jgi:hypothetical protein